MLPKAPMATLPCLYNQAHPPGYFVIEFCLFLTLISQT